MELYQRGKVYWCTFVANGVRYRLSTKHKTKTAAATAAAELLIRTKEGVGVKRRRVPTLSEFSIEYFVYEERRAALEQIAPGSLKYYRTGWKLIASQKISKQPMDGITSMDVAQIEVKGGPSSLNNALRTLRRMLNVAVDAGIIRKERPEGQARFPTIVLAPEKKRTEMIDARDDETVVAILHQKRKGQPFGAIRTAWPLQVDCGLRPCEVVSLRIEGLDFANMLITTSKSKTASGLRTVPMTTRVWDALKLKVGTRTEGWLFPSPKHVETHIGPRTLTKAFAVARRRGLIPLSKKLYSTRHAYGTDMMRITQDPYLVMRMMGHANLSSGVPYQHQKTDVAAKAMQFREEERHNLSHTGKMVH